ncbi:30S ribosomal protein S4 [Candidatus Pacearchaeota archaeon]|nr:30S ribosomal protein S4 [Candidatus Pacearchaeota archaeon]
MKRKHKTYSKPKRPFDKVRIDEEAIIKKDYGLKNKKEIWKSDAKIKSIREKAKKLIGSNPEEQKALFDRLKKIGLEVNSIADVLSLDQKDFLNRRLQTVLVNKKLATTSKSARQLITHRKVLVEGRIINSPSYIVPVQLEDKITLKEKSKKKEVKVDTGVPQEDQAEKQENKEKTEEEIKEEVKE